ncbi:hypothetical protein [Actinomycetospora lemnae]|uniref:Phosphodiesterase n=1 Tax=Actinomycetospora lemnae TaxID=3019891 RepID=A0ABT5T079_9PSEU|nr:hypothetical protein [Actinomycetospora sp. DW7H6]MDD7968404.1 hypothetical protein [Actinomycetospora sp. DW7H6]
MTTPTDRLVDETVGRVAGPAFALASFVRRARVFHPHGRTLTARLHVRGDDRFAGTVLGAAGVHDGAVRFSRGAGVPEPLPDVLGLALRLDLADGPQDLLLVSSAPAPIARHAILPARDYGATHYSSIVPFRLGGTTVVLGARPEHDREPEPLERLAALERAAADGRVRFTLLAAHTTGPWSAVGEIELGTALPDERGERRRHTPFHDAGGIEPVGVVNALRRRAYADSQAARPS